MVVDLVTESQVGATRYPFGSGASEATKFFTKMMVTNDKRSAHKLSGAVQSSVENAL